MLLNKIYYKNDINIKICIKIFMYYLKSCELILGTRDPKMSDEEFEQNVADRMERLKGAMR